MTRSVAGGLSEAGARLAMGAVCCGVLALLHLLLRGVIITEVVDAAQIITGDVRYPAGHPHQVFYSTAPALPNYIASAIWLALPDPAVVSAVLNWLFLFLATFLPYAVVVTLTGRAAWGITAAALTLTEGLLLLQGVYPLWVLPNFYVHGHLGIHIASLGVLFTLLGFWRSAGLVLGILPAFHAPTALLTWPWLAGYAIGGGAIRDPIARHRFLPAFCVGAVVFAALLLVRMTGADGAAIAPYLPGTEDAKAIFDSFTAVTDVHARPFRIASVAYGAGPLLALLIGGSLAILLRREPTSGNRRAARQVVWLLGFIGIAWAYVFGAWLYQRYIGPLPAAIALTRPYRFSNVSALFIIPLAITLLAYLVDSLPARFSRRVAVGVAGGLVMLIVAKAGDPTAGARLAIPALLLMLVGVAAVPLLPARPSVRWVLIAGAAMAAAAALVIDVGRSATLLAVFGAGFAILLLLPEGPPVDPFEPSGNAASHRVPLLVASFAAAVVLVGLPGYWDEVAPAGPDGAPVRWDRVSAFDRDLNAWLASNAEPGELILPAMSPRVEIPAKTGHPVLIEPPTLYLMSYMPNLAGVIGRMVDELYGVRYGDPAWLARAAPAGRLSTGSDVWLEAWRARSLAEWQALGARYDFRLVLAPSGTITELPVGLAGPNWTMHVIPRGARPPAVPVG